MEVEFIIVGQGLAGTCLARALELRGNSFVVINEQEKHCSSKVAAGIFNPITGKRLVKTWMADDIFPFAMDFYQKLEEDLNTQIIRHLNVYKPYASAAEENDIVGKSSDDTFAKYLNLNFDNSILSEQIENESGGVEILKSGNLLSKRLIETYGKHLDLSKKLLNERFDIEKLDLSKAEYISYGGIRAKKIIFAEGHQATENPLFSWLPFTLTKGEILELKINNFQNERIINRGGFLLPTIDRTYLAGASYERKIDQEISEKGKAIVEEKISAFLKKDYEIVGQRVGIRPTVKDRRPFLGHHPEHQNTYIFNGLGTKGVTLGPWFADHLANHLTRGAAIMKEVDINRYFSDFPS